MSDGSVESSTEARWLPAMRIASLLIALAAVGCAEVKQGPPPIDTPPPAPAVKATAAPPAEKSAVKVESPVAKVPAKPPAEPQKQSPAKAEPPVAQAPVKPSAEPRKQSAAPSPEKKDTSPRLDLTALETRLKETTAIGFFTKIALKNQVDDLLDQFRGYYAGRIKTTLAELRGPYDRLLLKVLSLLQDDDPALAHDIVISREVIWGILADPAKFATL